jgi:zinc transport system permease protein
MSEFLEAVRTFPLMQRALLTALLASIACGVVGTYVVVRRISYLAGGIAHCVLGGMGAAVYLQKVRGVEWLSPLHGAVAAALLAAGIIGIVSLRFKQREDTVISALWATGMAAGVLFIYQTPGYQQDLMSYLFGSISIVAAEDLWLIAALDAVVVVVSLAFYKQFLAVCFDEEYARTRGIRVEFYYLLLLCLTALTVVLLATVVGIILVIALLTLPVAIAGQFARRLWQMMLAAAAISALLTTAGLAVSYAPRLPAGATVIVRAGGLYLAVMLLGRLRACLSLIRRRRNPVANGGPRGLSSPVRWRPWSRG